MLSRLYFPYHPKPQPDELLSSWIIRTALGHGQQPYIFCHNVWPQAQIWTRDIDNLGTTVVWQTMAERTGVLPDRAWSTTLRCLEGELIEAYPTVGFARWILPLGIYHRTRRRFGLQFCSICLWTDERPYFRRHWRLGWVTACMKHGCRLRDRCHDCGAALAPHRSREITACSACSADLREGAYVEAEGGAIRIQVQAEQVLAQGWGICNGWAFQRPFLYFEVLRQIVRILVSGKRASRLRQAVISAWAPGTADRQVGQFREMEFLPVEDRHFIMTLASHLIADWPHRFIEACTSARLWWSWAMKENDRLPFAYEFPVKAALFRIGYVPSVEEVRAAVRYLLSQGKYPSSHNLRMVLGESQHLERVVLSLAWRGR